MPTVKILLSNGIGTLRPHPRRSYPIVAHRALSAGVIRMSNGPG